MGIRDKEMVNAAANGGSRRRRASGTGSASERLVTAAADRAARRDEHGVVGDVPDEDIPSLQEIKRALPEEMFRSDVVLSMYYVVRIVAVISGLGAALLWAREQPWYAENAAYRYAATSVYWLLQGTTFWGVFTLGHDCGHSSFSRFPALNWVVGNALHTFILTPYESWRVSHRHHHKNTGNMDRDEIFYPQRENQQAKKVKVLPMVAPPVTWFAYLCCGHSPRNVYHFLPSDPLFIKSQGRVTLSVLSYGVMLYGIYEAAQRFGQELVWHLYGIPILVFATWLVLVTFLHHNEPGAVWYSDETWNYVKGNLKSVDRSYWPFNNLSHDIGTHQIHHLFPIIPHYNLVEATRVFRLKFPHLVRKSDTHFIPAFFEAGWQYLTAPSPTATQKVYQYPVQD